jgi:hypothetical protein
MEEDRSRIPATHQGERMSRIDEIRKRLDAATPGPWVHATPWKGVRHVTQEGPRCDWITCHGFQGTNRVEDGDFIANAPSDLAFLLAEVERYKKALDEAIVHGKIRMEGKYVATDYYLHPHEVVPTLSAYLKENA